MNILDRQQAANRVIATLALLVMTLAPALLLLAGGERWWVYVAKEQSPMTWLQSVVLVANSLLCATHALTLFMSNAPLRRATTPAWRGHHLPLLSKWHVAHRTVWAAAALGFAALALDERFAVHERVRDRILAPAGLRVPFMPWVAPGDFLMMLVALAGLVFLLWWWQVVADDVSARRWLIAAVACAVIAVAADSVDPDSMSLLVERIEQTAEECLELASGVCLAAACATRLVASTIHRELDTSPLAQPVN